MPLTANARRGIKGGDNGRNNRSGAMTQQEKMLDLLRKGPVMAKQAHAAGIKKTSAVVCVLRQAGHKISSEMVKAEGKIYARYTLAASGPVKLSRGKKANRAVDCKVGDTVPTYPPGKQSEESSA